MVVVDVDPGVQIGLQLLELRVHFLPERDLIELLFHCSVEAFADAVCLRTVDLRLRVFDVIDRQVQLVVVTLGPSTGWTPKAGLTGLYRDRRSRFISEAILLGAPTFSVKSDFLGADPR